jgi:ribosomal protein L7Ae-like RNA K-turn-binding protein
MRPDEAGEGSVELDKPGLQAKARNLLATISDRYQVSRPNYIKPGIGEATRVLLRREARLLVLQDLASEATRHLRWLAEAKAVPIAVDDKLPYRAVALIKEMLND